VELLGELVSPGNHWNGDVGQADELEERNVHRHGQDLAPFLGHGVHVETKHGELASRHERGDAKPERHFGLALERAHGPDHEAEPVVEVERLDQIEEPLNLVAMAHPVGVHFPSSAGLTADTAQDPHPTFDCPPAITTHHETGDQTREGSVLAEPIMSKACLSEAVKIRWFDERPESSALWNRPIVMSTRTRPPPAPNTDQSPGPTHGGTQCSAPTHPRARPEPRRPRFVPRWRSSVLGPRRAFGTVMWVVDGIASPMPNTTEPGS